MKETEIYINQLIQENIGLMKRPKLSKHDRYVLELSDKIKHDYDSISINVLLRHSKRSLGEIDIAAKKAIAWICMKSSALTGL